jgi:hypothetical protein
VDFHSLTVETRDHRPLGHLAGFVVDPVGRQLRYLVLETHRWFKSARRMVPLPVAWLDVSDQTLRVDLDEGALRGSHDFDRAKIRELSSDDLVAIHG